MSGADRPASTPDTRRHHTDDRGHRHRGLGTSGSGGPAADEYIARLRSAERAVPGPYDWLFSWGYHPLWHGRINRAALDEISHVCPIAIWHRSCHEWFLNSAAVSTLGLTRDEMSGHGAAGDMVDFDAGHWWETGMNLLLPALTPVFMSPQRVAAGLRQMVAHLHGNGVTAINEPGLMTDVEPWELYQQILGADETPFLSTFLVDARSQADSGMDPADAVADAQAQVARAGSGKVRLLPKQVKLLADGAIISQRMQMRDPYLDDDGHPDPCHHGEWMMRPETFRAFFRAYWHAGWQAHIHARGLGASPWHSVVVSFRSADGTCRPAHAGMVRGQPPNAGRSGGLPRTACLSS